MSNIKNPVKDFGDAAKSLSHNPLGIIALFIVLVYGFASLVTIFTNSWTPQERLPLVYFLIVFPVLVLGVFAWLVSRHSGKLFAPSDFKNEDNYVKMQLAVVASLSAATAKQQTSASEGQFQKIVETARAVSQEQAKNVDSWRRHVLWVDDRPENNTYERQAFEAVGIGFTLALSTNEAFERLSQNKYSVIISDMGRKEGPREGYVLLDRLRQEGDNTPLFFYAASSAPQHKRETLQHGGQGCTDNAEELFKMVMKAIMQNQVA